MLFAIYALLLLLMLLPSQAKFSRKTKEQVLKTQSWYLGDFFVSLILRIDIIPTMLSLMVMIISLSLKRKLNWKLYVSIETRESFFDWRPAGTAGKFLLIKVLLVNLQTK